MGGATTAAVLSPPFFFPLMQIAEYIMLNITRPGVLPARFPLADFFANLERERERESVFLRELCFPHNFVARLLIAQQYSPSTSIISRKISLFPFFPRRKLQWNSWRHHRRVARMQKQHVGGIKGENSKLESRARRESRSSGALKGARGEGGLEGAK